MSTFTNEEKIQLLTDLVEIKSVNDHEVEVARYLKELLKTHTIDSEIIELGGNRANLVATIGSGSPVIGISGHMDVVSEGDASNWKFDPFTITEEDGKLYGRGSTDMKAGLAALVITMIDIKEQNLLPIGTIKLLVTAAEESTQLGSKYFRENGFMDDVEAMIIAEPTGAVINYANKGSMNFHITSTGKAAHSSMPNAGKNAIQPLIAFIGKVIEKFDEVNDSKEFSSFDFMPVIENFGGVAGDTQQNQKLADFLGRAVLTNTIFNGGSQINSIPDHAEAFFNARTVTEFKNEELKAIFEKVLKDFNDTGSELSLEMLLDLEPAITSPENDLVRLATHIGEEKLGVKLKVGPTTGVTDASNLIVDKGEAFPLIIFGPGETSLAHKVDEFVTKDSYFKFIDIFTEILTQYTKKK